MYSALFVSDAHIGSSKRADEFLDFLDEVKTKKLFLVGDLIDVVCDGPDEQLDRFFDIIKNKDCEVFYFFGNHEKENPHINGSLAHYFKDIKIYDSYIYSGLKYKLFIEHGDSFHNKDIFNRLLKFSLKKFKRVLFKNKSKKEQLAKKKGIYYKIKPIIRNMLYNSFVNYMASRAKKNNCDGVICGHLHCLEQKEINNIIYINCGDWLNLNSFVIEDNNGNLELVRY